VVGGQAFLIVVIAGQGLKVKGERWKVEGEREGRSKENTKAGCARNPKAES